MGDGGKNSRVVLHPRVSGKRAEIERLRGALAVLLEEIDSLLSWRCDAILARYARDIGHLEHALYRLEATVAELRYRIAFLQAAINRGEAVTAARMVTLDGKVAAEFEKTRREIERREDELRKAERYLDGPTLSPEDARELFAGALAGALTGAAAGQAIGGNSEPHLRSTFAANPRLKQRAQNLLNRLESITNHIPMTPTIVIHDANKSMRVMDDLQVAKSLAEDLIAIACYR